MIGVSFIESCVAPGKSAIHLYCGPALFFQTLGAPCSLQYLGDDKARAAEGIFRICPDSHDIGPEVSIGQVPFQPVNVEVLVITDRNDVGIDLLNRQEHVVQVAKDRIVDRF